MKISITRPLIAVAAAALLSSCMGEKFHVEGNVKNAKDSVLYFEHNGLEGFTVVDSVKLDETGTFHIDNICKYIKESESWIFQNQISDDKRDYGMESNPEEFRMFEEQLKMLTKMESVK